MVVGCQPLTGESMRWIKDTVSGLSSPHDAAARNRVAKVCGKSDVVHFCRISAIFCSTLLRDSTVGLSWRAS